MKLVQSISLSNTVLVVIISSQRKLNRVPNYQSFLGNIRIEVPIYDTERPSASSSTGRKQGAWCSIQNLQYSISSSHGLHCSYISKKLRSNRCGNFALSLRGNRTPAGYFRYTRTETPQTTEEDSRDPRFSRGFVMQLCRSC